AAPRFALRDQFGRFALPRRAADQADPWCALENLLTFLLRDAAEDNDDLLVRLRGELEVVEALKDFLRSLFADAACVVEEKIGISSRVNCAIAAREKHPG